MISTNVTNSLCMNKITTYIPVLLSAAVLACFCISASAQPYDRIERRNFWNAGRNINGLRTDSVTISFAQIQGTYQTGDFMDTYMAPEGWSAGAVAKTMVHLEKISMKGEFSFRNFTGWRMTGSMSGRPGYYPVDVLEFTPGNKTRQTYSFEGGIAADIAENWRIGGEIKFKSENYTKRKDLRHTDYLLDMTVTPAVMYHNGDFAAGLSYIFGKSSESITAEVVGISSGSYYAFLDKGLMYGVYDIWDSQGTHLSENGVNGFPTREISNGAAVQFQWKGLYAEAEYLHSAGETGEKQSIWYRFPSDRIKARAGYSFGDKDGIRHYIRITGMWNDRKNYETVIEDETESGVTISTVYGQNRILRQRSWSIAPEYEVTAPGWELRAGAFYGNLQEQASQVYPYLFYRNTEVAGGFVTGMVKIWRFDLRAGISFRQGGSNESERISGGDTSMPEKPFRLQEYNDMHMEYITAPQIKAGISLRLNFWKGLYVEPGFSYGHGFALKFLHGADRWDCGLAFGYTF